MNQYIIKDGEDVEMLCFASEALANAALAILAVSENDTLADSTLVTLDI